MSARYCSPKTTFPILRRTFFVLGIGLGLSETHTASAQEPDAPSDSGSSDAASDASRPSSAEAAVPARLSDRAELNRIIELYMAGDYGRCSLELSQFLDPEHPRAFTQDEVIDSARLYYSSCALLDGDREQAREALLDALRENPLMPSPDSLTFPPPVVSLFLEVRDEVQQLIADREKEQVVLLRRENEIARRKAEERKARERQLRKLAQEEVVVAKNSRAIASIPFGVGQFQNQKKALGGAFLATEVLLLATAVTSGLVLEGLVSGAAQKDNQLADPEPHNKNLHTAHQTLTWSSWAFLGVAAVGILEAHLSYKPERSLGVRERALPPDLQDEIENDEEKSGFRLTPLFAAGPGGGTVGLSGAF